MKKGNPKASPRLDSAALNGIRALTNDTSRITTMSVDELQCELPERGTRLYGVVFDSHRGLLLVYRAGNDKPYGRFCDVGAQRASEILESLQLRGWTKQMAYREFNNHRWTTLLTRMSPIGVSHARYDF